MLKYSLDGWSYSMFFLILGSFSYSSLPLSPMSHRLCHLVNFQNCAAIKKKIHYGFKAYPYPNILIPLANWTTYICFHTEVKRLLFFNVKGGGGKISFATINFSKWEREIAPSSFLYEVVFVKFELQIHNGASVSISVQIFSGVCVAQSSVFCVLVICCQPLHICLFVMLYLYIYTIYCYYK